MFPGRRRSAPLPLHCENIFIPFPWPFPTYNKFEQGDHETTWAKVSLISLNDNIMNLIRDNTVGKGVDCLRLNAVLNNCLVVSRLPVLLLICFVAFLHQYFIHHAASSPTHMFRGFLTPVLHTTYFPSNEWLVHNDICQTSERMRWGSNSQPLD